MKELLFSTAAGLGTLFASKIGLGAIGFKTAGITAGSYAASMMSSAAVANGGAVASGSTVALLQSLGAAGFDLASGGAVTAIGVLGYCAIKCFL